MNWIAIFHNFLIPFLGGLSLTLGKLIADRKLLSWDESNDISLDLVLVAVGALGVLYIDKGAVVATIDAGIGDAFLAMCLLYLRHARKHAGSHGALPPIHLAMGIGQLFAGLAAIIWTVNAF